MGSTGEQLGVMKLSDALRKAQSLGLDLVEVAPTANPPVCKIVALGKFRYDISKHEKGQKTVRRETEGDQVSRKHRRARLPDEDSSRRRISRQRQQGPGAASISRPRNGAPGIRDAADAQGERRSFRHVAGRNGTEDHRPQRHHDVVAVAGEPPQTAFSAAPTRQRKSRKPMFPDGRLNSQDCLALRWLVAIGAG